VNRVVKRVDKDVAFTKNTGKYRDRELAKALRKSIPDDRHREALELYLTRGMSTRQLGEKYGLSHVAIHKWIHRGKERLISYLRQHQSQALLASILAQFESR
jgi:DNA-directed RNA polymerase specialized sigma24 family protein